MIGVSPELQEGTPPCGQNLREYLGEIAAQDRSQGGASVLGDQHNMQAECIDGMGCGTQAVVGHEDPMVW